MSKTFPDLKRHNPTKGWIDYENDPGSLAVGDLGRLSETDEPYGSDYGLVMSKHLKQFALLRKTITRRTVNDLVLRVKPSDTDRARQARLTGPIQFLVKLLETWRLTAADGTTLLGLETTDPYVKKLFSGRVPLRGRDTKDRIAYLFRIRKTLSALFRDDTVENAWLRDPHDLLDGKAPMDLLLEGSMENLLLVKEYVEAAAGR